MNRKDLKWLADAASKDDTRKALGYVYINGPKGEVLATCGRTLHLLRVEKSTEEKCISSRAGQEVGEKINYINYTSVIPDIEGMTRLEMPPLDGENVEIKTPGEKTVTVPSAKIKKELKGVGVDSSFYVANSSNYCALFRLDSKDGKKTSIFACKY